MKEYLHVQPRKMRRMIFYVVATLLSALFLFGFWDIIPGFVLGWLPDRVLISIHLDIERFFVPHRIHQMAMHAVLLGLVLGVVLQLYHPERRVAPLLQALTVFLGFNVIELAVGHANGGFPFPEILLFLLALLRPRVRDFVRLPHVDGAMVALTVLSAMPWTVFARSQAELARLNLSTDVHAQMEHWQRMAVFAVLMAVWGLIASTDLPGWRLTAWSDAYGSVVYGLQSLFFPDQASAATSGWALAAVGWGVAYLIVAERRARASAKNRDALAAQFA